MDEVLSVFLGLAGGAVLGVVFFGGLWLTVRRALSGGPAALWFAGSYLLRLAIVAAGLYLLAHDDATRGACAVAGLLAARLVLVRRIRKPVAVADTVGSAR